MIVLKLLKNIYFYINYVLDRLFMSWSSKTLHSFPQWLKDEHELGLKESSFIRVTVFLTTYIMIKYLGWTITLSAFAVVVLTVIIIVKRVRK